jgi:F-type H+-transporting ATPase subunit delta
LLESIVGKFLDLRDKKLGIVNVQVRSAVPMSDAQEKKLRENYEKLLNKKVKFEFTIDPTVIGGFVAKVGDTVYDASLKNQLEILKKRFLKGGASLN